MSKKINARASAKKQVSSPLDPWETFLANIRQAQKELRNPTKVWYRGQWRSGDPLIPSLHRVPKRLGLKNEQSLFYGYLRAGAQLVTPRETDWETLFDMQHYGLPTRLLDWTETLGIAVFFALGTGENEAAVYVLDPVELNHQAIKKRTVNALRDPADPKASYKKVYWGKQHLAPSLPIAIAPPFQNDRLLAQRGTFTVHGTDEGSLEEQCPNCVRKVILPANARTDAMEFLSFAGLDRSSIFPDIVGVIPHIRDSILPKTA